MALLDRVSKAMEAQAPSRGPGQAEVQDILRQRGGKAVGARRGPRASNLRERQEMALAQQAFAEQKRKGKAVEDQLSQQEKQLKESFTQAQRNQLLQEQEQNQQITNAFDTLLQNAKMSRKSLEQRKDAAALEQAGFLLRNQSKRYKDNLLLVGEERRLRDKLAWQEELTEKIYGDNLASVMRDISFKAGEAAGTRDQQTALAQMSLEDAEAAYKAAMADANTRAMWEGGYQVAKGGILGASEAGLFAPSEEFMPMPAEGPVAQQPSSMPQAGTDFLFTPTPKIGG